MRFGEIFDMYSVFITVYSPLLFWGFALDPETPPQNISIIVVQFPLGSLCNSIV